MTTPSTVQGNDQAIGLSAALFGVAALLATLGALLEAAWLLGIAAAAMSAFALLELRRIRRAQRIAALVLVAIAIAIALPRGLLWHTLATGALRTLPFILIFAAVGWLRAAAEQSPSVLSLREGLSRMGPGHRFSAFAMAAHVMGAGFNLAGIGLLAPMLDDDRDDAATARRLRSAILWGFSTASAWSPFLVGTAAVLAAIPQLEWLEMVPYGLVIAGGFLVYAVLFDRVRYRKRPRRGATALHDLHLGRPVRNLAFTLVLLFALTLSLIEGAGLALTTAIAVSAPIFALSWLWLIHRPDPVAKIRRTTRGILSGYDGMRTETTLFIAANTFGTAISEALPGDGFAANLPAHAALTGLAYVDTLAWILAYLGICALGIHPIVLLVIFTTVTDPAALGIPLPLLGGTFMALWGMGTSVSPLSGTTLFMAQMSPASSFEIAWRWNGLFYGLGAFWLAAAVTLLG